MDLPVYTWFSYGMFIFSGMCLPSTDKYRNPATISPIWKSSVNRFKQRARASGFLHAMGRWEEALSQVRCGWLSEPIPFSDEGGSPSFSLGATDAAFRFGVAQWGKLRRCDYLRRNMANLSADILTPSRSRHGIIFPKFLGPFTRPIAIGRLLRAATFRLISSYQSTHHTLICLRWRFAAQIHANGWLSSARYYFLGPFLRCFATTASLGA